MRIRYKSHYSDATQEEQGAGTYVFIVLVCLASAVLGCSCHLWCRSRRDRKRQKQQQRSRSGSSTSGSQRWPGYGPELAGPAKSVGFKGVEGSEDKRPNGTKAAAGPNSKEYKPVANSEAKVEQFYEKRSLGKGPHFRFELANLTRGSTAFLCSYNPLLSIHIPRISRSDTGLYVMPKFIITTNFTRSETPYTHYRPMLQLSTFNF
jgi:hypothetical protein